MVKLIPFEADNVVGAHIDGKITEETFDFIKRELEKVLEQHENVRFYAEIPSFEGMEPTAFFKDLKFAAQEWTNFEKEAVVTDKQWMETIVPPLNKLFPNIEVKVFSSDEKDAARAWIQA